MGIFSKRKNSKKSPEVTEVLQLKKAEDGPPVLRLNSSECSLPEFGSARSGPPVTQRPCLKRATRSESSIYLKVHAVNNRLTQRASRDIGFEESTEYTSTTSSRSSSRSPKRVSFKLDSTNNFEQGKIRESRSLRKAIVLPPPPPPRDSSDSDDGHDSNSITSLASSASSWTSNEYSYPAKYRLAYGETGFSGSLSTTPSAPRLPTQVASGFERKMSRLPPVQMRDDRPKPKIVLGHSKNGQPRWDPKTRPRRQAAH